MKIIVTQPVSGFTVGKKYIVTFKNPLNYLAINDRGEHAYIMKSSCKVEK
ncbi:hypothetical protein NVP1123O_53 [Vibrio phage 1.123.O._10N.286.48.F3]|nr:hypothetical protein NVP1123O_53 [Vibrio phage 1.123.O._10N.286.48.F3]